MTVEDVEAMVATFDPSTLGDKERHLLVEYVLKYRNYGTAVVMYLLDHGDVL